MVNARKQLLIKGHDQRVYDTSRWEKILHDTRRYDGGCLVESEEATTSALQEHLRTAEDPDFDYATVMDEATLFGLEVFSRLYNKPDRLQEITGPRFHPVAHELMDEIDEFEGLCKQVRGDADFCALGAAKLVERVASKLPDLLSKIEEQQEQDQRRDEMTEEEREQWDKEQAENGLPSPLELGKAAMRGAMRAAIAASTAETLETKKALSGLLPGTEVTPASHEQESSDRMKLAELIKDDERLKDIMRKAGRIRRIADSDKKVRSSHAVEEVVDIEMGRDLARMLPSELAQLNHPLLKNRFFQKFAEGRCLQYKLEGNETLGRGPIVVLLDESGSMKTGGRHEWARAIGLVAIGMGLKQKRAVTIIGFNKRIRDIVQISPQGDARQTYATTEEGEGISYRSVPMENVTKAALMIATTDASGGTDFDDPINAGLDLGGHRERADLIIVTDGVASVSAETIARLESVKKDCGLHMFGVTVGGGHLSVLEKVCDSTTNLDITEDKAAALAKGFRS